MLHHIHFLEAINVFAQFQVFNKCLEFLDMFILVLVSHLQLFIFWTTKATKYQLFAAHFRMCK